MARSVFQYEQPRCPDNWNEAERRFYNRLIETLDDIYSKYGRLDEKMLSKGVLNRIDNSTATSLEKMTADILSSGKIAADSIEATFAYLVSLSAKYGSFDFETVKNLVADAMVLEKGQADYVHITNLAATYAQAVNATIGNLVIQSSDGKYYQLDVSADGKVSASEVKPSDKEISAGETSEGKVIVGTHITAETLGTATLAATQALINMIDASRINVDTLVAREEFVQTLTANEAFVDSLVANTAFIKQLGTTTIVGDKSLTLIASEASDAKSAANSAQTAANAAQTAANSAHSTANNAQASADNLDRLSNIEVIEGTFAQTERREGEGIRIYSEIGPKQDLKWGAPWPGGAGKNLLPNNATSKTVNGVTFTVNADGTVTANGTATANTYFYIDIDASALIAGTEYILSGCPGGGSTSTYRVAVQYYDSSNAQKFFGNDIGAGSKFTRPEVMKSPAWFIVVLGGVTVSNLIFKPMIRLASITDATYAPYANTPPIEGWTGLDAFAGGKNLLPSTPASVENNGITFTANSDGTITANGTATSTAIAMLESFMLPKGDYILSGGGTVWVGLQITDANGANSYIASASPTQQPKFSLNGTETVIRSYYRVDAGVTANQSIAYPMIRLASDPDATYAPYQSNTYFLDFGETVYGGTVDWHAGEMTVEWCMATLTGNENITSVGTITSGKVMFNYTLPGAKPNTVNSIVTGDILCSHYAEKSPNDTYKCNVGVSIGAKGVLSIYDSTYAVLTLNDFKAYLAAQYAAGTPVQIAYILAEPYTIQLTPVQIETLQGINTVYTDADGGRVEFGHSPIEDLQNAVDALEEAAAESALYLKLDAENKVVRIGQTEITSEFDIDAYGAGVVVGGKVFSRFEGERVLIGDMEMRKPANIGGLAFDSIMT